MTPHWCCSSAFYNLSWMFKTKHNQRCLAN